MPESYFECSWHLQQARRRTHNVTVHSERETERAGEQVRVHIDGCSDIINTRSSNHPARRFKKKIMIRSESTSLTEDKNSNT